MVPTTVLNNSTTVQGRPARLGRLTSRYWTEAVVVAIAVAVWVPRLSGPIDLRWDAGVYYVLGTSLATCHGYRILSEPGSPKAVQYPPLLPAIVALYQRAVGSTDPAVVGPWLRISYAALFLAYALAVLVLAKRYLRPMFAVIAAALSLFHLNAIFLSDLLFTELPFALITVLFVLVGVDGPFSSHPRLREAASFVLATAGFLLRTAGVALLAAWVIEAVARGRWRLALVRGLLAMLPIIAWGTHVAHVRASYEYAHPAYAYQRAPYRNNYNVTYAENAGLIDPSHPGWRHLRLSGLTDRLLTNAGPIVKGLGEAITTSEDYWSELLSVTQERLLRRQVVPPRFAVLPIVCFSALVIAGVGVFAWRRDWLVVLAIFASVALIWTTPWPHEFQRYLMPLAPFLATGAMLALCQLRAVLSAPRYPAMTTIGRITLTGAVLLAFVLQAYTAQTVFYQRQRDGGSFVPNRGCVGPRFFYHGVSWCGREKAIAWIQKHSAPDAIVLTRAPQFCYLRSGRRAVFPPVESNPERARRLIESVPASYVIVNPLDSLPAVETDPVNWRRVDTMDGVRLYERIRGAK